MIFKTVFLLNDDNSAWTTEIEASSVCDAEITLRIKYGNNFKEIIHIEEVL